MTTEELPQEQELVEQDTHFEIALDEEPEPTREPVYVDAVVREHDRRPVIPASLRGRENIKATIKRETGLAAHRVKYHGLRSPRYSLLGLFWAIVGVGRLTARLTRWMLDTPGWGLQSHAANEKKYEEYRHTAVIRSRQVRPRLVVVGLGVLVLAVAVAVAAAFGPWWLLPAALVVLVPVLARIGRPVGKPIVSAAVVAPRFRKLNPDIVLRAYYAAGLGRPDKPDQVVTFGSTMARDGDGSRVVIDLPYGKGFDDMVKDTTKSAIASGLDVSINQVFLTRDPSSHRRHSLWVADRDPLAIPAGRTPLLDCRPRDIWKPAPFGLDERGQKVTLDLLWNSMLIGAQPRKGKTFAGRLVGLYAALDPYVKISLADGKKAPDWRGFRKVADRAVFGTAMTRDGDPFEQLIDMLEEIKADAQDRNDRLSALPANVCPEGKLTRAIARDPKYNMPVRVIILEEFQEYLESGTKAQGKHIGNLFCFLVKVAPSVGVITVSLTQKPSSIGADHETQRLFTNFRDNHALRFALRCGSWTVSNAVLGGDAQSEGYNAATLPLGPEYKGIGYLYGAADEVPLVRTYLADLEDAEKILTTARRFREEAGTLSGQAAGEEVSRATRDVLADVIKVWSYVNRSGITWERLAELLASEFPDKYGGTDQDAISALVRAQGVPSENVKSETNDTLKGCKRTAVEAAINRREITGR